MKREVQEYIFVLVVIFFIAAFAFSTPMDARDFGEGDTTTGMAYTETQQPFVKLISPDKYTTMTTQNPTFSYEVHNVNTSVCSLVVDGRVREREQVDQYKYKQYGEGSMSVAVERGGHTWKVQCTLPSKVTVSSEQWNFNIVSPERYVEEQQEERAAIREEQQDNAVTGNVVNVPSGDGFKGLVVALIGIAGLVWGVHWSRK